MKRGMAIAIRVLMLQLIAVSVICCTDSLGGRKVQSYDLRFELATSPNTKSQEGSELPAVWALESKTGQPVIEAMPLQYDAGLWRPVESYSWKANYPLDFYAASPLAYASFDSEKGICFESYDTAMGYELLYTEPVLEREAGQTLGLVSLTFQRPMSLLRIYIKQELLSNSGILIKSLTVDGLKHKGSFNSLPWPRWSLEGEAEPFLLWSGELAGPTMLEELCESYVLPQSAQLDFTLLCDVWTGVSSLKEQELCGTVYLNMVPGKLYELYLTVTEYLTLKVDKNSL